MSSVSQSEEGRWKDVGVIGWDEPFAMVNLRNTPEVKAEAFLVFPEQLAEMPSPHKPPSSVM